MNKNKKTLFRITESDVQTIMENVVKRIIKEEMGGVCEEQQTIIEKLQGIADNLSYLENVSYNDLEGCDEIFASEFDDIQYDIQNMLPRIEDMISRLKGEDRLEDLDNGPYDENSDYPTF